MVEAFLEVFTHIVSNLADAVNSGIPDLGYWVLQVLDNNGDHGLDLRNVINVLPYLGKCH